MKIFNTDSLQYMQTEIEQQTTDGTYDVIISDAVVEPTVVPGPASIFFELPTMKQFYHLLKPGGISIQNVLRPSNRVRMKMLSDMKSLFGHVYCIGVTNEQYLIIGVKLDPSSDCSLLTLSALEHRHSSLDTLYSLPIWKEWKNMNIIGLDERGYEIRIAKR
jgi:spermidine synthase